MLRRTAFYASLLHASLLLTFGSAAWAQADADEAPALAPAKPPIATLPARPVALVAELSHCGTLEEESALRRRCLEDAGRSLEQGLLFQRCLWRLGHEGFDCSVASGSVPLRPRDRQAAEQVLVQAEQLAQRLVAGADLSNEELSERIDTLRRQAAPLIRATRGRYTLVSQGGVSLGSWQAGYVYYLSEVLKARRDTLNRGLTAGKPRVPAFHTLAGASAGAINALAAGIETCRRRDADKRLSPQTSLFYRVWVETLDLRGPKGLYPQAGKPPPVACLGDDPKDAARVANLGLFSKVPLCQATLLAQEELTTSEQEDDCAFNYGLSVTHLQRVTEPVFIEEGHTAISASKLSEYFAFRIRPAAPRGPLIENLEAPNRQKYIAARLPASPSDGIEIPSLLQTVRASGAFPVAFPPVRIVYQTWDAARERWVDKEADFVDGGTLDNTPIGFAAKLNDRDEEAAPNPWLADLVTRPDTYFLVNPNIVSWKTKPGSKKSSSKKDLLGTYLDFARELFEAGSQAQLASAARDLDWLGNGTDSAFNPQLAVPKRHLPVAGAQFAHFMAFLEEDFRVFDFYVGLLDGMRHLRDRKDLEPYTKEIDGLLPTLHGVDRAALDADTQAAAARLDCLRAYDGQSDALAETRMLGAMEPDPESVGYVEGSPTGYVPASCRNLGNFGAMLVAMHNFKLWMTSDSYDPDEEFDAFFDHLRDAGYVFGDATLAENPRYAFSLIVRAAIDDLAARHSRLKELGLETAGRLWSDTMLTRTFSRWSLGLGYAVNGVEGIVGHSIGRATPQRVFRWSLRPRIYRAGSTLIERDDKSPSVVGSLFTGPTVVFDRGAWDLEFSLGASWSMLMLPTDRRGFVAYGQFGGALDVSIVALRRIYAGMDFELYPKEWMPDAYADTLLDPSVFRANAKVGWRFLH